MKNDKKLKLVQVCATLKPELGGPVAVISQTFPFLSQIFDLNVLVYGVNLFPNLKVLTINSFKDNNYGFALRISNDAKNLLRNADIVLLHGFYVFSTLRSIFITKAFKIFIMPHGSLEEYQNRKGRIRKWLFRKIFFFAIRKKKLTFLVASESEVIHIKDKIPNAVVKFVGLGVNPSLVSRKFRNNADPLHLLCLSRVTPKKRIDLCIRAIAELADELNCILTIAGTGSPRLIQELKNLAGELGLSEKVKFVGLVEGVEKERILQGSDLLLLPSENENFAISIAEAIVNELPVVISQFVAMKEFVISHATGEVIPSLNSKDLARAIQKVVSNYDYYVNNCFASKEKLYWENVMSRWERALND